MFQVLLNTIILFGLKELSCDHYGRKFGEAVAVASVPLSRIKWLSKRGLETKSAHQGFLWTLVVSDPDITT